jgi:hypothetical protein
LKAFKLAPLLVYNLFYGSDEYVFLAGTAGSRHLVIENPSAFEISGTRIARIKNTETLAKKATWQRGSQKNLDINNEGFVPARGSLQLLTGE